MTIMSVYGSKSKLNKKSNGSPYKTTQGLKKSDASLESNGTNLDESKQDIVDKELRMVKNRLK